VVDCAADVATKVDAAGFYTYVVGRDADRPAAAGGSATVTWLSWGREAVGVLALRNMLPAEGFAAAIQRIGPGQDPAAVMGEYYPRLVVCSAADYGTPACEPGV
jgi:hypothetical protein